MTSGSTVAMARSCSTRCSTGRPWRCRSRSRPARGSATPDGGPAMTERVLLTNARVVTCSGDPSERPFDGDVLLEGDRVAGVFHGRAPVDPQSNEVEVVDVAGATLMPGLCDAHTHISWPLDFVFNHPEITAMPDDEHALEVAGVVGTYLRSG